ncbi:transposase [Streptomyces sp. PmtA]
MGPKGGRREKPPRRRIVDAIFYVVRTGCALRQLPKDFAPWPTVYWYFTWHDDGTVERIHDALRGKVHEADGRDAEASAGLFDSQSVRTAEPFPLPPGASTRARRRRAANGIETVTLGGPRPLSRANHETSSTI